MPVQLTEETYKSAQIAQIKLTLEQNNWNVGVSAMLLGLHRTKLSQMLNGNRHLKAWWQRMRAKKKKDTARRKRARYRARLAERAWLDAPVR